ncbi:MAG: hypothetical protein WC375_05675 [Methanomassiliicoccales archaeon]
MGMFVSTSLSDRPVMYVNVLKSRTSDSTANSEENGLLDTSVQMDDCLACALFMWTKDQEELDFEEFCNNPIKQLEL